jgi:hypothetical protein
MKSDNCKLQKTACSARLVRGGKWFGRCGFTGAARFCPVDFDAVASRQKHVEAVDEIRVTFEQKLHAINDLLRVNFLRFEFVKHGKKAVVNERHFSTCGANAL